MQSMCFRPSGFRSSQRMRPCHNRLQRERQAKFLICLHQDLKQSRGLQLYLKCFPVPNATHSSSTFIYSTREIVSTTTSVSAVRVIIFFCSIKKYSCVGLFVGASTDLVQVYFCGGWDHAVTASRDEYFARNWSSFCFFGQKTKHVIMFSSFFKKLFQVEGNGVKGNTLRRWPWPYLLLVPAFKMYAR